VLTIDPMRPLNAEEIRASLVNVDEAERTSIVLPGLHETLWEEREFLGWRDPTHPTRGYIVFWNGHTPTGVAVRAAESAMPPGRPAMCSLCHTQQPAPQVSLFVAPKAGQRGKRGDTVGTYLCADLRCSTLIRITPPSSDLLPHPDTHTHQRAHGIEERLGRFTARVVDN
jgi:hypothetical protein